MDLALVVIDAQRAFEDAAHWGGGRSNAGAEDNIARLLASFRQTGRPVIHIRHASVEPDSPLRPERPGHAPLPQAAELPGEPLLVKSVNGAFAGAPLAGLCGDLGVRRLATVGVQTDHCVSTTVRQGSDLGYAMVLVEDATWTYDKRHPDGTLIHAATLQRANVASLAGEFCEVATTDGLVDALS